MRMKKIAASVSVGLVVLLLAAQLVPYGAERTPPPRTFEPAWSSPETRALAELACFDCHSADTRWPWYAHVAPVSWLVRHHVEEGRAALNFSTWDTPGEEAKESGEVVREGEMPPGYYLLLHPEARLTDAQREALAAGLDATIGTEEERAPEEVRARPVPRAEPTASDVAEGG